MQKINKIRGRFLFMSFDINKKYIALIKTSEVLILRKNDFLFLQKIKINNCIFAAFYEDNIILGTVSKIEIINIISKSICFTKRIKCNVKSKYMLDGDLFICEYQNNENILVNLKDYSTSYFSIGDFYCLSFEQFLENYLVVYKTSQYTDNCNVAIFNKEFQIVENCFTTSVICSLTLKVVGNNVFYFENGYVKKYDLCTKGIIDELNIEFLPFEGYEIMGNYMITNHYITLIIDQDLQIVKEYISDGIFDPHTIGTDGEKLYICRNNEIYTESL